MLLLMNVRERSGVRAERSGQIRTTADAPWSAVRSGQSDTLALAAGHDLGRASHLRTRLPTRRPCDTLRVIVVVTGNDGVGKSTFVQLLAPRLGATVVPEPFDTNPFAADYLRAPERWTYQAEVEFMRLRAVAVRAALAVGERVVCDRYLWDDVEVFSELWRQLGVLDEREVVSLRKLARDLTIGLPEPNAVVWMRASIRCMVDRVVERGYFSHYLTLEEMTERRERAYTRWLSPRTDIAAVIDTTDRDLAWLASQAELVAKSVLYPAD
jgi:deoxyadenosine/deoxycytidine kinase